MRAYNLALAFLDSERIIAAAQNAIDTSAATLKRSDAADAERSRASCMITSTHDYTEAFRKPETVLLALEVELETGGRIYISDFLYLKQTYHLPTTDRIYRALRRNARNDIFRRSQLPDERDEVLAQARTYAQAGLLRLLEEDIDIAIELNSPPSDIVVKRREYEAARLDAIISSLDLARYGIPESGEVSMDRVAQFVKNHHAELIAGIQRNYYWQLKGALYSNAKNDRDGSALLLVDTIKRRMHALSFVYYLVDRQHHTGASDSIAVRCDIEMSEDDCDREREEYDLFLTPASFAVARTSLGKIGWYMRTLKTPFGTEQEREAFGMHPSEAVDVCASDSFESVKHSAFDVAQFYKFLRDVLRPEKDFSSAREELVRLQQQFGFSDSEVEKLSQAIAEFGNYHAHESLDRACHVGQCLSVPSTFNNFCKKKFGIELEEGRYTFGMKPADIEEAARHATNPFDLSAGYEAHFVSVFGRRVVIDWTDRQFTRYRNRPFPDIYPVGQEQEFYGPLYPASFRDLDDNYFFIINRGHVLYRQGEAEQAQNKNELSG